MLLRSNFCADASIKVNNKKLLLQNDHRKVALGKKFHVQIRAMQPRGGRFYKRA
jgi:hypothetical protein